MDQPIICREAWQKMLLESMPIRLPLRKNSIKARTKWFSSWGISRHIQACVCVCVCVCVMMWSVLPWHRS